MPNFEEVLTQHANCPPFFMNKPSDLLTKTNLDATPLKRPQRKKSVGVLVTHTMKYCLQIMFFCVRYDHQNPQEIHRSVPVKNITNL